MSTEKHPRVQSFIDIARQCTIEEFTHRHKHSFLVMVGFQDDSSSNDYFTKTRPIIDIKLITDIAEGVKLAPDNFVFEAKKRYKANPYTDMVTIGRADNCDIIIPITGVSKFHSYIRTNWDNHDDVTLGDGGSRNGTGLNDTPLEEKGTMPLANGDTIELGSAVVLRYFTPAGFWEILRR